MKRPVFHKSAKLTKAQAGSLDHQTFQDQLSVEHYQPSSGFQQFVDYYWIIRWDAPTSVRQFPELLPKPHINVYLSQNACGIQGIHSKRIDYTADATGFVCGIAFRPGGFHAYWVRPMSELRETNVAIDEVFPHARNGDIATLATSSDELIVHYLEDLLHSRPSQPDDAIDLVNSIVDLLDDDFSLQTVAAVAQVTQLSQRSLQRLFQEYVGVGLKWVLLRNRLLAAVNTVQANDSVDWARLAADTGYSSQSHFVRDFARATGLTPSDYLTALKAHRAII